MAGDLAGWMGIVTISALFGELLRQDKIRVYNYSSRHIEEYTTKLGVNAKNCLFTSGLSCTVTILVPHKILLGGCRFDCKNIGVPSLHRFWKQWLRMEITQKKLWSQVRPTSFVVILISADSTAACSTLILYSAPVGLY